MPRLAHPRIFTIGDDPDPDHYVAVSVDYQRNGVCGNGFWTVGFVGPDEQPRIGIYFGSFDESVEVDDGDAYYAVVTPYDLSQHWRGDHFVDALKGVIRDCMEEVFA